MPQQESVANVRNIRRRQLIPPWSMPSDPVRAVFWFMRWSLSVLTRFFWIVVLAGVIYESILNKIVGGVVTLLIGLGVWLGLGVALAIANATAGISKTVAEVRRMQHIFPNQRPPRPPTFRDRDIDDSKIVEGTVTDLDEERKKRRHE